MPKVQPTADAQSPDEKLRQFMRSARLNRSATLDTILTMFQENRDRRFRAIDFTHEGNLSPGSVHPVLDKLVRAGCVNIVRVGGGPPPTDIKFYEITDAGIGFATRYRSRTAIKQI